MAANNIYIEADFESSGAQKNVNALNDAIGKLGPTSVKTTEQASGGLKRFALEIREVEESFTSLYKLFAGLEIVKLTKDLAGEVIKAADAAKTAQIAFTGLTGSAQKAEQVLHNIEQLAKREPFAFRDLVEGGQRLAAFGVSADRIPGILKSASAAAAAMGGGTEKLNQAINAFGLIIQKNFVGAADILRNMGRIGVQAMDALRAAASKQLGRPVSIEDLNKFLERRLLDVNTTIGILQQSIDRTKGQIGEQLTEGTVAGQFQKLKDATEDFAAVVGKDLVPVLLTVLHTMQDIVETAHEIYSRGPSNTFLNLGTRVAAQAFEEASALSKGQLVLPSEMGAKVQEKFHQNIDTLRQQVEASVAATGTLVKEDTEAVRKAIQESSDLRLTAEAKELGGIARINTEYAKNLKDYNEKLRDTQASTEHRAEIYGNLAKARDADLFKYRLELQKKLDDAIRETRRQDEADYKQHLAYMSQQLQRSLEIDRQLLEEGRSTYRSQLEHERTQAGQRAELAIGQLDVARGVDPEQTLQKRITYEQQAVAIRIRAAEEAKEATDKIIDENNTYRLDQLQATLNAMNLSEEEYRQKSMEGQKVLNESAAQAQIQNAQDTEYEIAKIRLDANRRVNEAIIEEQKKVYEEVKGFFGKFVDAVSGKNPGQALADLFRSQALDLVKKVTIEPIAKNIAGALVPTATSTGAISAVAGLNASVNIASDAYITSAEAVNIFAQAVTDAASQVGGGSGEYRETYGLAGRGGFGSQYRQYIVQPGGGEAAASPTALLSQALGDYAAQAGLPATPAEAADRGAFVTRATGMLLGSIGLGNAPAAMPTAPYDVGYRVSTTSYGTPSTAAVTPGFTGGLPPGLGGGGVTSVLRQILGLGGQAAAAPGVGGNWMQQLWNLPLGRTAPTGIAGALAGIPALFGIGTAMRGGSMTMAGGQIPLGMQAPPGSPLAQVLTNAGVNIGGTSLQSVLTSKGAGMLASFAGMSLLSAGLRQRVPGVTALGGGLAGFGTVAMNPQLLASTGPAGLGAGAAAGIGAGLFASGIQQGGGAGALMDIGGGALAGAGIGFIAGGPLGAAIGAAIGAGAGAIAGVVRLFVKTKQEQIRASIKQIYGVDISNRQILTQVQQIIDQKYGGSISVGVRSQDVQDIIRLYALSTGQAANLPRPMYAATVAEAGGKLALQPVYQGGQLVQNPYTGPTTYQYQTAVTEAQGLKAGTSLGPPGATGLIQNTFIQLNAQQAQNLMTGQVVGAIQANPSAVASAGASAARAGDSRMTTTAAMTSPLTALP